jgi:hypothetical protein
VVLFGVLLKARSGMNLFFLFFFFAHLLLVSVVSVTLCFSRFFTPLPFFFVVEVRMEFIVFVWSIRW